ncbi:MBL fold metallo-hydrolase [Campylobacter insulaenigrae]|uniref:MBL fold metallo-hydrolase n=1 Tax=Campylobacter insulaenigrae TaxID=260714 RepID=UPI002153A47A|nr:MBL fold metallo-hydrolase [Campylobacter insulaenigrae]MCR6593557.1 MBL fold metallo-hydrolase [Campylobacter insulaenigrae]
MRILKYPCGPYETNCYIVDFENKQIIIDPGQNALKFIKENVSKPLAILNTHGHYDHVFDNAKVKKAYQIPIYIHKNDEFMLKDPFNYGFEHSNADFLINDESEIKIDNFIFKFHFFPGHTPGCTMIELVGENIMFSGDFLFHRSIGRWDFPYSNADLMKESLLKILTYEKDFELLPGHGEKTTLKEEQQAIPAWLRYFN